MERNRICKPATDRTKQDLLNFAPCPPPMLNYSEFREHALSRNLCHQEVCNITRRCLPSDTDAEYCSLTSTTTPLFTSSTDSATVNTSRIPTTTESTHKQDTDYSINSSTFSTGRTTFSPAIYTSSSNTSKIILSVICPAFVVLCFVGLLVYAKGRKRKRHWSVGPIREQHSLQVSKDMQTMPDHVDIIDKSEPTSGARKDSACDETDLRKENEKKDHSESNIKHDDTCYLEKDSTMNARMLDDPENVDTTVVGGCNNLVDCKQQYTTRL